jgi:hypothetical protein
VSLERNPTRTPARSGRLGGYVVSAQRYVDLPSALPPPRSVGNPRQAHPCMNLASPASMRSRAPSFQGRFERSAGDAGAASLTSVVGSCGVRRNRALRPAPEPESVPSCRPRLRRSVQTGRTSLGTATVGVRAATTARVRRVCVLYIAGWTGRHTRHHGVLHVRRPMLSAMYSTQVAAVQHARCRRGGGIGTVRVTRQVHRTGKQHGIPRTLKR